MPVTINGTTGITTPDVDSTADITANSVPFGKGTGSGSNNTVAGIGALNSNSSGNQLTIYGRQAGYSNTSGIDSTIIGYSAGYSITTGNYNTVVGKEALVSATTASSNTAIGYWAGYNTTGPENTFVGTSSGYLMTTGSKNTILGRYSGNQNGLDIRGSSNNIVLSDGDGAIRAAYVSGRASFALKTANQGIVRVEGATEDSVSVANGSTLILTNTELGSAMVCVYDNGSGIGAVFFASYISGTSIMAQDGSGQFATSDSAGFLCVYKNAGTHTLTLKNNLGTSRNLTIAIYSGQAAFN